MLIIGSRALVNFGRKPLDWDIICSRDEYKKLYNFLSRRYDVSKRIERYGRTLSFVRKGERVYIECEFSDLRKSAFMLLRYCNAEKGIIKANRDVLLTLKLSHRYLKNSPFFIKTMNDIHFLRGIGAETDEFLEKVLKIREKETYDYDHPSLMSSKEDFFNADDGFYVYDHDDIHKTVAVKSIPMYVRYLKDNHPVMCDRKKWEQLSDEDRLLGVAEEAMVLSLERSLIPFDFKPLEQTSFETALFKVCTSITSGWFREYAWEHYHEVIDLYKTSLKGFSHKFVFHVKRGEVKKFERKV